MLGNMLLRAVSYNRRGGVVWCGGLYGRPPRGTVWPAVAQSSLTKNLPLMKGKLRPYIQGRHADAINCPPRLPCQVLVVVLVPGCAAYCGDRYNKPHSHP